MTAPPRQSGTEGALAVRMFGQLEMNLDGAPFKFATPRKSLQVLAYLLLHRRAPVTREYLAYVLFPDDEEAVARTRLRSTIGDMQKILPGPIERYVSVEGESIAWNSEASLWLDVDTFEAASADPNRLNEAIALYRGDLLPQIYDEWIESERERHRNTYLRCLGEAVSLARRNADFGSAIEAARKILTVDPWREDVVRRIIAMRYESGDRSGALSEYRQFAKRLREEMGADPMPETAGIIERIQRGLEIPADGEAAPQAASAGKPVLPFVGRGKELGELLDAWNGVARGRGTFVFLGGETGIGKSRLALEFAHIVEERGGRVLIGRTGFPEAVPYESVSDALRGALPLVSALKADLSLAAVASIVPELRERVDLPELPRLTPESELARLFDALAQALGQLSKQRPLLLLLEDVHWGGPATQEMLQFLLRRVAGKRVMVLLTFRDDETPRTHPLQRLRNDAQATLGAQTIRLGRLSDSDVADICAALPDERSWPVQKFAEVSQGHPHFLTQLVLDMREGTSEASVDALGPLLLRRIERLSSDARTAAEIAACIGDNFSRDAVREVSAWDDATIDGALDELLDRRIVRETSGRGLFEYSFAHHAVHEAVESSVPPQRDAVRRRRVARVLEELYPERATELSALIARHYDLGGDAANAARSYLDAARHAIAIGAVDEARSHCERGTALALDLRLRCELLLERSLVESRRAEASSWNAALDELERAEAELGDITIHRAALLQRYEYGRSCDDRPARINAAAELRRSVQDEDPYWQAQAYLTELRLAYDEDRFADAVAAGERGLVHSRKAGDHETTTRLLCEMALAEAQRGHRSAATELFRATREAASQAADPTIQMLPVHSELGAAHLWRDNARAVELGRQWLELAIQFGDRAQQAKAHNMLAIVITATGKNFSEARQHFAAAAKLYSETIISREYAAVNPTGNRAILETRVGFFDRGLALSERALEMFTGAGNVRGRAISLDNLVFLRAYAGDFAGARNAAQEAIELARSMELGLNEASILENLAFAEGTAGNLERALELAESSFEARARSQSQIWSCKTIADTALWHVKLGDMPAARAAVQRLLADEKSIVEGTDFPTYCYWAAAQIFHIDGRTGDAARMLAKGRHLLQSTAEDLEDEDRAQYLSIPWNADLLRAIEENVWPDPPR